MRILLITAAILLTTIAASSADEADYGPDWPACQNLNGDPRIEIEACNRVIAGGKLSQQHLAWAYNDRGTAWRDLGRLDLAEQDFIKSSQTWPANWQANFNLGLIYSDMQRFGDALAQFDRVVAIAPDAPQGQCNRGRALESLNRFDEAKATYEQAIESFPDDACSILRLIGIYDAADHLDAMLAMIDRSIERTGGGTPELFIMRSEVHQRMHAFEPALADLDQAAALGPRNYEAVRDRGRVLAKLRRYDEALKDLNRAIALAPRYSDGYFWRANVELRTGATKAALEDCQYALSIVSDHTPCILISLHAAFMRGDFGAAAGFASQLPANFFPSAPLYHGVAVLGGGKVEAADAELRTYTVAEPNDPYGWLWLYLVDRRLGRAGPVEVKDLAARRDAWPTPLFRYIQGTMTADEVLAAADVPDPDLKQQRFAEANFYLGALVALAGDAAQADAYRKASLAIGYAAIDPIEHIPVYDDNNALELGMAIAPEGGEL
jgi:tetratricopeptide (TPR) repeat protein